MKKSLLIISLFAMATLFSCQNDAKQKVREQQIHDSFAQLMSAKDTEMQGLFQELNDIDSSLTEVTNTYANVSKVANTSGEISKDTKANIKDKIATIKNILDQNKRKVANVNSKIKKDKKENEQLKTFVKNLEARIQEQEGQIQALTAELAKKNIQIDNLTKNVDDLNSRNKQKDAQIMKIEDEKNTAYFVVGTKKELIAKKLVDRKGGFIGLGKSETLANNADFSNLTKIDIRNTQEIPLTGKKIKIVTSHPTSSYSLEGNPKMPSSIRITNPEQFWRGNKCLVIMVD
jgi:DNA repair exonuclease SbcCD ATPase subunit